MHKLDKVNDENCAESIELPTDQMFRNLKNAKRCAIDIGGSLVKLAYYTTVPKKRALAVESDDGSSDEIYQISEEDELRDQLHFIKFETKYIETCVDFIQQHLVGSGDFMKGKTIKVTGSGAYKYKDLLSKKLGVQIDKEDELQCLIKGCNFLLKNIPDESFIYQRHGCPDYSFQTADPDTIFPYMLVNIGSGVSFIKVDSENSCERIGGTSIGGGTFWGLGSIITKAKDFDELLNIAEQGDHRNVDMLVGDIYGGMYTGLNLPADLIASSFGKAARSSTDRDTAAFGNADIAKSLLIAISNDIGQIACLTAKLAQLKKIYFGGYFIRGRPITMHTITYAVNYWSKGEIQAMFLRHEGYLGAIGAFLKVVEEEGAEKYCLGDVSWAENYAGSSGLASPKTSFLSGPEWGKRASFDMLELDRFAKPLVSCPLLLDSAGYFPDTVDLTKDEEAREYWLNCFEEATEKFAERAVRSQPSKSDAEKRAHRFKAKYSRRLQELKVNPCAYGSLTVRSLLDTREHCLAEFHFVDPYSQQKQQENEQALKLLVGRLEDIDSLPIECQWLAIMKGVLGGNVFDWGAKEVASMMEMTDFGFHQALSKIQQDQRMTTTIVDWIFTLNNELVMQNIKHSILKTQPWLIDNFDSWLKRLEGPPHKCAAIFVDNSGIDIILGIFPFARALLKRGTNVVLCANSRPVLNDVTYNELSILTKRVALLCEDLNTALSTGRLLVMESGQVSPCLDLRYIDYDLSERLKDAEADLVVLEGMGRAIHTNFDAAFACESLKIAVIKNQWLATRLGGDMYGVVFKYESARRVRTLKSR